MPTRRADSFPADIARWEIDDLRRQISAKERRANTGGSSSTITPATPFHLSSRLDESEDIWVLLAWLIPDTLRSGKIVCRRDKGDGTYGHKHTYKLSDIDDDERDAGTCEREVGPFKPNQTWHVVRTKGTIINPTTLSEYKVYEPELDADVSLTPAGTPVGQFSTGAGGVGLAVPNHVRNGMFQFSDNAWKSGASGSVTELAHWRYNGSAGALVDTTVGNGNYWDKTKSWIVLGSGTAAFDVSSELKRRPFKAGHPINVGFQAALASAYSGTARNMVVTLEDSSVGVICTMTYDPDSTGTIKITSSLSTTFQPFRFTGTVSSSYTNPAGAQQYIRFHLDGAPTVNIYLDLVSAHQKAGAYSPHQQDEIDDRGEPDGTGRDNTNGRGGASWQGGPSDVMDGKGQVLKGVVD